MCVYWSLVVNTRSTSLFSDLGAFFLLCLEVNEKKVS